MYIMWKIIHICGTTKVPRYITFICETIYMYTLWKVLHTDGKPKTPRENMFTYSCPARGKSLTYPSDFVVHTMYLTCFTCSTSVAHTDHLEERKTNTRTCVNTLSCTTHCISVSPVITKCVKEYNVCYMCKIFVRLDLLKIY